MSENVLYDNLKTLCEKRRSRRRFLNATVPEDVLSKIIAIAKTSPYASGKSSWDIQVVTDRDLLRRIAEVVREKTNAVVPLIDEEYAEGFMQYASHFTYFEDAPAVFFLSFKTHRSLSMMLRSLPSDGGVSALAEASERTASMLVEWERDSFIKSIACVAMLVLLAAESLGLGGCFMTGPLIAEEEIARMLPCKQGRHIGAIIPIGYLPNDGEEK